MLSTLRRCWPVVKALIGLAILYFIARQFARDLAQPELYEQRFQWALLIPAAVLYLIGLGASAVNWGWMLTTLGHRPRVALLLRAYYVGQLGKYVPGKALALFLRAAMADKARVPTGLAGLTAFYEVLTTMASGVLLASVLFAIAGPTGPMPDSPPLTVQQMLRLELPEQGLALSTRIRLSGLLAMGLLVLLAPPVFNRLLDRLTFPFRQRMTGSLPRIRWMHLLVGLALGMAGWLCMGLALATTFHAVPGAGLPWTAEVLARLTAALALAYVAGFLVLVAPGGLGVRELFLKLLLTGELVAVHGVSAEAAAGQVVLVVLLLRLSWTVGELVLAALLYPLSNGADMPVANR